MFVIFYGRSYRHSCKKRRQMLFGNARIKYLRTASIQIFPQAVSCRVSAARTSVRARVDWKRQSAFVKCSRRCPRRGSHGCSHRCSSRGSCRGSCRCSHRSRKCSHRGSRRCSLRHCINAGIDWVWSACADFPQTFVLSTRNGYVKCRFKEYGAALLQKCLCTAVRLSFFTRCHPAGAPKTGALKRPGVAGQKGNKSRQATVS